MPRDFVQRNKPTPHKRNKSKAKSGRMTRVRTLITLIIVVAFIGLLLLLRGRSTSTLEQDDQTQPTTHKEASATTSNKADASASSSTPVFDFYNLLPDAQVEAPQQEAYRSTPKDLKQDTLFWLQTDSFRNIQDAENRRVQLILLNMTDVNIKKTTDNSGTWYKVRIGPYDNRAQLDKIKHQLDTHNTHYIEIKKTP